MAQGFARPAVIGVIQEAVKMLKIAGLEPISTLWPDRQAKGRHVASVSPEALVVCTGEDVTRASITSRCCSAPSAIAPIAAVEHSTRIHLLVGSRSLQQVRNHPIPLLSGVPERRHTIVVGEIRIRPTGQQYAERSS
ncbi:MAG: hypothetical protein MRJ92_13025 [Nitrospira sp.]|nr:hypothetical protein [Nitrospira sp.]